jgi:hypothetical protein
LGFINKPLLLHLVGFLLYHHLSSELKISKDLRQGDALAPVLFNVVLETAI